MGQTVVYPRQYRVIQQNSVSNPQQEVVYSKGDQTVDELFRYYEVGGHDTSNLNFRLPVLDCALRLFGDFKSWVDLQVADPNLVGYNLEFVRDVVRYVLTGQRDMSPLVWLDLVSENQLKVAHAFKLDKKGFALPDTLSTSEVLQKWCSHHEGFADLLQTLYVFFGSALLQEQNG